MDKITCSVKCPQCGYETEEAGAIRCPRCYKILISPVGCGGACGKCTVSSKCTDGKEPVQGPAYKKKQGN